MFEYVGSWGTSHSFGLTPLICKWAHSTFWIGLDMKCPPKSLMCWTSWVRHVRWLAYKALVWAMDSLYWWVHSWTSSEETRPVRGRRPLRHDFGGCITTQTLPCWVPISWLPRGKQFSSVMENCLTEAKWPWTETLKQSKSSLLQLVHLRHFVKWHKSWVRHLPGRSVVKFRMIDVNYPNTTLEIEFALKNDCI